MITITLADKKIKTFEAPITVAALAESISPSLAKVALAGEINGKQVDLSYSIDTSTAVRIITETDPAGLEIIRHSTAHLLAHAVKQLFPDAQVTIGPVIIDGFYYDFFYPKGFTHEDLFNIEKCMHALADQAMAIKRFTLKRDEAVAFFEKKNEGYKAKIIAAIPENEILSFYQQGDFVDLCRGPHVPNTRKLKAFKLMKVAGAYWRGDSKNEMLQRIYGTAWLTQKELQNYLYRLEEAEKRDHRKLAKKLDLFHLQEAAPGMIFWHPNGWTLYQTIKSYLQSQLKQHDYQEVHTPMLADYTLWEQSGHAEKFSDMMFHTESEKRHYAIKPMNCPCHVQIFNATLHSYRDLPIRLAEFGACHRNEPSGALHGLMRVRGFTQDDAHIFCTETQIQSETLQFINLLYKIYKQFGFTEILVKLSTRPEKRLGEEALWDKAEEALKEALEQQGLDWELNPGEGAFYGPKIEFSLKDSLHRVWQCGTLQLDFVLPQRLQAEYVSESGKRKTPVILHRAILGSFERFIGILLEHYAEGLPFWLAPVQTVIMNITDKQREYCSQLHRFLQEKQIRAKIDLRNEKIGLKIREHTIARIPYLLTAGDRELENKTIDVRTRAGENLGSWTWEELIKKLI